MENEKTPHSNAGNNSGHRHTLMMILCCLIPLLLLGILWAVGVSQNVLSFGILLLCPVMHLLMMKNMKHGETPAGEDKTPHSNAGTNKREL